MKRNAPLVLIELVIMLLVFAVVSALCVRAFVWADSSSRDSVAADMALLHAQNAAELLKQRKGALSSVAQELGGQWDGAVLSASFDEDWNMTAGDPSYILLAERGSCETAYLGQAKVTVLDREGNALAELFVCWQEVTP